MDSASCEQTLPGASGFDAFHGADAVDPAVEARYTTDRGRLGRRHGDKPVGIVTLGDLAIEREPKSALADISAAGPNN